MGDDEVLECMRKEQDAFEAEVFEMLFGADARPPKTVDEYRQTPPRVFSYEDAVDALDEVGKFLDLLFRIKERYRCPENDEDDTQEAYDFRELVERLMSSTGKKEKEKENGG